MVSTSRNIAQRSVMLGAFLVAGLILGAAGGYGIGVTSAGQSSLAAPATTETRDSLARFSASEHEATVHAPSNIAFLAAEHSGSIENPTLR